MSRAQQSRAELLQTITHGARELATVTVMFHSAVAEQLGLTATEYRVFDFALQHGPVTAGQLASVAALTTGAITGVIDRLEAAGYVKRVKNPTDRRKVMVHATLGAKRQRRLLQLFAPLARGVGALAASYSNEELAVVVDYLTRVQQLMRAETVRLRGAARAAAKRARKSS